MEPAASQTTCWPWGSNPRASCAGLGATRRPPIARDAQVPTRSNHTKVNKGSVAAGNRNGRGPMCLNDPLALAAVKQSSAKQSNGRWRAGRALLQLEAQCQNEATINMGGRWRQGMQCWVRNAARSLANELPPRRKPNFAHQSDVGVNHHHLQERLDYG